MSRQDDDYLKQKETEMNEALEELHRRNGAIDVDPESPENQTESEVEAEPEVVATQAEADGDAEPETAEATDEEGDSPATLSNEDLLKQINEMRAEFERSKLEAEKWKFVASREAGKRGFEKQTKQQDRVPSDLADLAGEVSDQAGETIDNDEAEWRQEQRSSIVLQEMGRLTEETPDFIDILPLVQKHVEAKRADYADAIDNGSPATTRKAVRLLYKEALTEARLENIATQKTAEQSRRQDTASQVKAKKMASAPPKSAPSNAGVKKAGPKGGAEPTQEELIAEYARRRASNTFID